MIKAVLFDFDGTLINTDMLTFVCDAIGKGSESEQLHQDYLLGKKKGVTGLIERINFLKGLTIQKLEDILQTAPPPTEGAGELMTFLKQQNILTIVASGNILPTLGYFQKLLGFVFFVGSPVHIQNGVISGISATDFPEADFKLLGVNRILNKYGISPDECLSIGDSIADKSLFENSSYKIAINPKNGFEKEADAVITNFKEVIPIIQKLNKAS